VVILAAVGDFLHHNRRRRTGPPAVGLPLLSIETSNPNARLRAENERPMSIENREGPTGQEVELDAAGSAIVYREMGGLQADGELRAGGLADAHLLRGNKIVLNHATKTARVFADPDPCPEQSMELRKRQRQAAKKKKTTKKSENASLTTTPRNCPKYIIGGGKLETRGIIDRPDLPATQNALERRYSTTGLIAQRAGSATGSGVYGYPVLWNTLSRDLGGWREQVAPGAFDASLSSSDMDVVLLFNHDSNMILGRERNATLHLRGDATGLHMDATLAQTTLGKDVSLLLERGDLRGMSFGFTVDDHGEYWSNTGGEVVRTVTSARLYDVSIVTSAAYSEAWAAIAKQRMQAWREDPSAQIRLLSRTDPYKAAALMRKQRDELVEWARTH
jgi:HK97 family phage prohead protease